MQTVILVVHILACLVMIGVILLQRSEGGALGIGGGGGGGLMSGRGAAGALVRTTMIFGAVFFVTSLVLTTMANRESRDATAPEDALEQGLETSIDDEGGEPFGGDLFGTDAPADAPAPTDPDALFRAPLEPSIDRDADPAAADAVETPVEDAEPAADPQDEDLEPEPSPQ